MLNHEPLHSTRYASSHQTFEQEPALNGHLNYETHLVKGKGEQEEETEKA